MSNEFRRPRPGVLCEGLEGGEVSERLLPRASRARQIPRGNTAGFWGGGERKVQTEGANGSKLSQNTVTRECWVGL